MHNGWVFNTRIKIDRCGTKEIELKNGLNANCALLPIFEILNLPALFF
jgi:hypothetical protein